MKRKQTAVSTELERSTRTADSQECSVSSGNMAGENAAGEKEESLEKKWEKAGLSSDLIFAHVMQNKKLFLGLMQRILPELQLSEVREHEIQKTEYGTLGSKGVRFDVYSEIDGKCFDVEMQIVRLGDEGKRTRYYQSMMDMQTLRSGKAYDELPDSYVVMIGQFDLFGKGRHIYRFRNIETKDRTLELQDGAMKVFLNSKGTADDIPQELQNFLNLINGMEAADDFCREISCEVRKIKRDAQVKENFMDFEDKLRHERAKARKDGLQEGLQKGLQKGMLQTLADLVSNGSITIRTAAEQAGVSESTFAKEMKSLHQKK